MAQYIIPPPPQPALPVHDGGHGEDALYPVRRVYCIGQNYAAHTIEMGGDPDKTPPFFFQKNPDNVNTSGRFPYPPQSDDVHFEIEMVVALMRGGRDIAVGDALDYVYGYAVGLDMTRRDLQSLAKKSGRPWEIGKAFEASAPMGALHPVSAVGHLNSGRIALSVNGVIRQQGDLNQMIWKVPEIIAYLSRYYDIAEGDVIMTGTPAGVGAIQQGDALVGEIEGLGALAVKVV